MAEQGLLLQYICGVPTHGAAVPACARPLFARELTAYQLPLDRSLVKLSPAATVLKRLARYALPKRMGADWSHRADALFDRLVARQLDRLRPDVVVAYENSALHTFRRAKKLGIATVLDAASFHHTWQDRFYEPVESARAHRRITRRKDEEIDLADLVLTVSDLARQSYREAGVPSERLASVPIGVDTGLFAARSDRALNTPEDRPIRFVFVGRANRLKGGDVLRDAWRIVARHTSKPTLTLIGERDTEIEWDGLGNVEMIGKLPHAELTAELQQQDVIVTPSRFDSFAMVVAEGMACGLPAIVTENVGAKEMVEPEMNGLVVPAGDCQALASAMTWFVEHRDRLPDMSRAARQSAEHYGWGNYRRRVVEVLLDACAT